MPVVPFTFSTTSNSKVITFERVGGVINVNVLDGGLEFQPLLSELGSYITLVADTYYTEGFFSIVDSSISFEFTGFSSLGCIGIGGMQWDLNYNTFGTIEYIGEPHTHLLSGNGNRLSLYAPAYFDIVGSSSGTVDFLSIQNEMIVQRQVLEAFITNYIPNIDFAPIELSLTTIKGYTDTIESDLAIVKDGISGIVLQSLNGNGAEFLDGTLVHVVSSKNGGLVTRDVVYTVKRSFHSIYADNAYIVCYDLESPEGYKLVCPESLLVRYEPVTTP